MVNQAFVWNFFEQIYAINLGSRLKTREIQSHKKTNSCSDILSAQLGERKM